MTSVHTSRTVGGNPSARHWVSRATPGVAAPDAHAVATSFTATAGSDAHPLRDANHDQRLHQRETAIRTAFAAIEPVLQEVAALQWQPGFTERARSLILQRLGVDLSAEALTATWLAPLDTRRLYAIFVLRTLLRLSNTIDRGSSAASDDAPVDELIQRWGFHAVDISPCADGRLSGVVDYILRIPPAVVAHRKSFAGATFDVEETLRNWTEVELRRHREAVPNAVSEPSRYLKIGVYHTSSSDPHHEGCAAHGSDEGRASGALLDRLKSLAQAVENSFCCGPSIATLLIGVDTDTDAIKVHVPNARGEIDLNRFVDNRALFDKTAGLAREAAKDAIRRAVADAAGVTYDDAATEGMRWFCGYLLKNNMAQIAYVRSFHGGRYAEAGHSEQCILVGDSFDGVQLRNLAYQAQMETIEEGTVDMDVGVRILSKLNLSRGLPIPVLVHAAFDGRVPGSRQRAVDRARRLVVALTARYRGLVQAGSLFVGTAVRDRIAGGPLEELDGVQAPRLAPGDVSLSMPGTAA